MTGSFFNQVARIQAGETVGPIYLGYSEYPRSAGWTLNCIIVGQAGPECVQAASDGTDADGFTLTIPANSTSTITGGRKSFVIEAVKVGTGTYIAERGTLLVLGNPRTVTPEMTMLANIRSVKAGLATTGQRAISLDGISLSNMTPEELDQWEAKYVRIVNSQIGRAGGNGGVYAIKMRTPQDNRYASPWYGSYPPPGGGL